MFQPQWGELSSLTKGLRGLSPSCREPCSQLLLTQFEFQAFLLKPKNRVCILWPLKKKKEKKHRSF